jgi:hypothetical protein
MHSMHSDQYYEVNMDKRKKLSQAAIDEIQALLNDGINVKSIASAFDVSTTHIYRIQSAMRNGEVKLKRSSLDSCMDLIETGLPFRRASWENTFHYFYDTDNHWFIKHVYMGEHGDDYEVIMYTLDLTLEDLIAKDWVVLTWESVNDRC